MINLLEYFSNLYNKKALSHAYLIGNTQISIIQDELFEILSKFFFHKEINQNCPDLYILDASEDNITKDQIKELLMNLSTTSQFNNTKVYIINNCEKMNDFVYNAILKTLEEPGENIYAFLITENINKVKDTIVSRCQRIFMANDFENRCCDEEIINLGNEIIKNIEEQNIKTIAKNSNLYTEIDTRDKFVKILKYIQEKYYLCIKNNKKDEITQLITKNNSLYNISGKILIIDKNINLLNNYLNKNLSVDKFIIEMWRSKNENSWN